MSKTKQKPIDELLKEALVPEDEQPYQVPENWVWVRLKSINKNEKRNIDPRDYGEEIFELYSVPSYDLDEPEYVKGKEIGSNKQLVQENEILLCKINPRINRVWIVSNSKGKYRQLASTEWIVVSKSQVIYPKYLLFLLKSPYFRKLITSNVSGVGGSLTRAKPKDVEMYPIAVPPLNEQKRIAEKVERLFAKIDEAKRLIEEVKESVELRRAAILDRAFRGELGTNDPFEPPNQINEKEIVPPNEQPYKVPENWVWVRLGAIFEQEKKQIQPTGTEKYIGLEHLISGGGIAEIGDTQELRSKKVVFKKGDVLYGKLRPYLNKHAIADFDGVASTDIIVFRNPSLILNKLLDIFLGSSYVMKYANEHSKGINLPRVSPKLMDNLSFPLPPADEQKRIVEKVSYLLSNLEDERQLVSIVAEMLDLLKQSILSKAFRGELGTNDPSDEHAIELLRVRCLSRPEDC